MRDIKLDELEAVIAAPSHCPKTGARIAIARRPEPFVAPTLQLRHSDSRDDPFSVEVIFVQASAAVGKSVMAAYLSSSRQVPLLNLAEVSVSTDSLVGLIQSQLSGAGDPVHAFHTGTLPLIIDALDEGRLLSGEQGFERFLETTCELLLRDRSVTNRPKVIFFGRPPSTNLAMDWLQVAGTGIETCLVEVGLFGAKSASEMIDVYACASAAPDASYLRNPVPVRELIEAYFYAIAAALGLEQKKLWTEQHGRAFAGYAPVLAALGSLLAEMDNFKDVANRLRNGGAQEAWAVIELVIKEILDREQRKLVEQLAQHIRAPVPKEAYDAQEQLTYLSRFVHHQTLTVTGRISLAGPDQAKYSSMVEQYLPEHPFIRKRELGNAVLGSLVIAHAISHDLLKDVDLQLAESLSRQPFLWRSLRRQIEGGISLIDGRYLGCILNSFWSDPITRDPTIVIRSTGDDGSASVRVAADSNEELVFEVMLPLTLYEQIRGCDVDIRETVTLKGLGRRESASAFYVYGPTSIVCEEMEVAAESIMLDGKVWFEADQITSPARLNINKKNGVEVGWAGRFAEQYPWNQIPSTLTAPYPVSSEDVLAGLIVECQARFRAGGVLILNADFTVPDDDARKAMRWSIRQFPTAFPRLIQLMAEHNLASTEVIPASGRSRKIRLRFQVSWEDLHSAVRDPAAAPATLREFVTEAREAVRPPH